MTQTKQLGVLLADDVPDIRMLIRMQLDLDPRFEVLAEAGDGAEAIRLAKELQPDLMVLDVAMPAMDGLQAIPLLHEAVPDLRILVLSGFRSSAMRERVLAATAHDYVEKGVEVTQLVERLAAVAEAPLKPRGRRGPE